MLYTSPHPQLFASGPLHQHPRAVHLVLVCKHCLRLKPHSRRQMQALVWESRSPPQSYAHSCTVGAWVGWDPLELPSPPGMVMSLRDM